MPTAEGLSPLRPVVAMVITALIGEYSLLVMPFILTGLMSLHGLSESSAGWLVSTELAAMAIASMIAGSLAGRLPVRVVTGGAIALIVLSNGLTIVAGAVPGLALARFGAGMGEGALMAIGAATIAASHAPHRIYSAVGLAVAVVAMLALLSVPTLVESFGYAGVFAMLALVPLSVLVILPGLPRYGRGVPGAAVLSPRALDAPALLSLCAFALLWVGAGALWVFAERIGARQGLGLASVATWLAVGQLVGIAGPLAADRFALRIGLVQSLLLGMSGMVAGAGAFVFGGSGPWYGLGSSLLSFCVMFLLPCFRTFMSRLDPAGRVVGISGAFYATGFAFAPVAANLVMGSVDTYGRLALFCAGAFVTGALLVMLGAVTQATTREKQVHES